MRNTLIVMKSLTVRLPEHLIAQLDAESRARKMSKSDIVRERLQGNTASQRQPDALAGIADLIGSVESTRRDVSSRRKHYLKATGYGRTRSR